MKNTVIFESSDASRVLFLREGRFTFCADRQVSQTCNGDPSNPYYDEDKDKPQYELRVQYEFDNEGMLVMTSTLEKIAMSITALMRKLSRNEATMVFFTP